MASSYFTPEPHAVTLAASPDWPVPDDTREPAAVVDEAVGEAMGGGAGVVDPAPLPGTVEPEPEPEQLVETVEECSLPEPDPYEKPRFDKMTKAELLDYCVEQDPTNADSYGSATKAVLLTEAEDIWAERYGPISV